MSFSIQNLFLDLILLVSYFRPEMVVGWYHSHPGFGCWLSGVDINTQQVGFCFLSMRTYLFISL